MQQNKSKLIVFIDDNDTPIAELSAPIQLDLDTRKLIDGEHTLKIVSKSPTGKEGIRLIPFIVRNGPSIVIEGLKENEVVDGTLPLLVHAYDKGNQRSFMIEGSETPHSIPSWILVLLTLFSAWSVFYCITNFSL